MAPNHDEYALPTRIHTAAMIFAVFLAGWNDGTLGPLIPRIQEVYHLGYIIVALLFVFASLGAITGAFLTINLTPRLGFGKMVLLAPLFQIVGYSLQAAALPYPVFALASFLNSIGVSILDAQANGYVASIVSARVSGVWKSFEDNLVLSLSRSLAPRKVLLGLPTPTI
ncbi:MFS domain-containing protein [Mycena chlorophos]|uniref:MFS domain-containing protein n=1 Tax=Mycena chlorophos TaxID=658473 RepID=A0A8H6TMJ9_MYCCL|nr:MFS domain-containing protein [Mycena chlorophos]